MSTGTKIVKSGSEPPTAFELEVSQVNFIERNRFRFEIRFLLQSNLVNSKAMLNLKVNYVNFTSLEQRKSN